MNPYHDAMEHCAPPQDLRARMEQSVLAARPGRARPFRPKGFRKKTAAVLLAAALVLTTGAASLWDPLFIRRFGPQAAMTALGGAVFQEVNVTSVCDDVSLTVTQALCSDKNIHYIMEYKLPDGFSLAEDEFLTFPEIHYYATGDYAWADLKALEGEAWAQCDWSDFRSVTDYFRREDCILAPYDIRFHSQGGTGQGSGSGSSQGYDPDTNTVAWLYSQDFDTGWDLNQQPLTILVTPPCVKHADGTKTAVTDHPAIITFQPAYNGPQALSGAFEEGEVKITATLSPFSLALEAEGMGYHDYDDMVADTRLVTRSGQEKKVSLMGRTGGGSSIGSWQTGETYCVSTTVRFYLLTGISDVTAIRMGSFEFPLS